MGTDLSEKEKQIIKAINKLDGKSSTKTIAKEAGMSPATASKYLSILEVRGVLRSDKSQLPYVFWEIIKEDFL